MLCLPALATRLTTTRLTATRFTATALALGLIGGGAALAQPMGEPGRSRLTPEQQQKLFPETRRLSIQDRRDRIVILQKSERCIAAAANGDALRACMREERQASQAQRKQHQAAMRQVFERNGIALPDWGKDKGRRGGAGWGGSGAGEL
jgi:hypothetical protein